MEVKLILSCNFDKECGFRLRVWMNLKTQSRTIAQVRMTLLTEWNSIRSEYWWSITNYKFRATFVLSDKSARQHHEVKNFESYRYENHYLLPVERRWTVNSGDRGGTSLVLAYSTIESVIEQLGVRRALWKKGVRLYFRIQEATSLQLRHRKAMDRQ